MVADAVYKECLRENLSIGFAPLENAGGWR